MISVIPEVLLWVLRMLVQLPAILSHLPNFGLSIFRSDQKTLRIFSVFLSVFDFWNFDFVQHRGFDWTVFSSLNKEQV